MASRSIGGIYASLTLKDTSFKAGLKNASEKLKSFGATSVKWAVAGAIGAGAGMAAGLIAGTKHTLSQVDALNDLSTQTGLAVDDMMKLQQAYKDGGREAEMAGKDIGKMQKAIVGANDGGPDPFAPIGLSVKDLISMNPAQQFNAIGAAIMRISNPAERTAKAMEIFGKGGMGLTTVFGSIPQVEKALGRMPELAMKFAGAMGDANDLIGHLPLKSDQFFVGFTAGVIGELLPSLEKIDNFDFTTIGQNLGTALATAFQTISDGSAWELFELQADKAMQSLDNNQYLAAFAATINTAADVLATKVGDPINYGEIADKYAGASNETRAANTDDLQARIDKLKSEIAAKYQANSDAAAAHSAKARIENPIDPYPQMPSAQIASVKESKEMVNDYQKRGLSLSPEAMSNPKEDKQTGLMTEMRNYLKKMADSNGQLVW